MAKYNKKEYIGKRYGRLVVVDSFRKIKPDGTSCFYWHCKCDCGRIIEKRPIEVVSGKIVSCGCNKAEKASERLRKHGDSSSRLYKTWRGMKSRCYRKNAQNYNRYGGRGIIVCDEWKNDYSNFKEWAYKNGYRDDLTIERIDVNGNYCPENCKWIPAEEQALNRRNTRYVTYNGDTHCVAEWGRILGINESMLARVYKGNRIEDAFKEPKNRNAKNTISSNF